MKKYLMVNFLFLFFFFSKNIKAQLRHLEVAVSYDAYYASSVGGASAAEDRINSIFDFLKDVYDNPSINIDLEMVSLKNFGNVKYTDNNEIPLQNPQCAIAQGWANYCTERDVVIHFTNEFLNSGYHGVTGGAGICTSETYINQSGGTNCAVSMVELRSNIYLESSTMAHEIMHQILGSGHPDDNSYNCNECNNNTGYHFFCQGNRGGGNLNDPETYLIASCLSALIDSRFDEVSCENEDNSQDDFLCSGMKAVVEGDNSISIKCGGQGDIPYRFFISAGNVTRTFKLNFSIKHPNSGGPTSGLAQEVELVSPNISPTTSIPPIVVYNIENSFELAANETYIFDVILNFDNVTPGGLSSQDEVFELVLSATNISPALPPSQGGGTQFDAVSIVQFEYDQELIGNTDVDNLLQGMSLNLNNGFDMLYGSDIIIDGTFKVDKKIELGVGFPIKMKSNANIIVEDHLTIRDNKVEPCDGNRWGGIIVKNGGTLVVDNTQILTSQTPIEIEDGGMAMISYSRIDDAINGILVHEGGKLILDLSEITNSSYGIKDLGASEIRLIENTFDVSNIG